MDSLKRKRAIVKGALTRFINYVDGINDFTDAKELQKRLEKCEQIFDQFNEIQSEIELINVDLVGEECFERERENFEKMYFEAVTRAQRIIDRVSTASVAPSHSSVSASQENNNTNNHKGVKLPDIKLPVFDGSFGKWLKFRDSFISMIDENQRLDNIEKLT